MNAGPIHSFLRYLVPNFCHQNCLVVLFLFLLIGMTILYSCKYVIHIKDDLKLLVFCFHLELSIILIAFREGFGLIFHSQNNRFRHKLQVKL